MDEPLGKLQLVTCIHRSMRTRCQLGATGPFVIWRPHLKSRRFFARLNTPDWQQGILAIHGQRWVTSTRTAT
jgi:hypothetical protein